MQTILVLAMHGAPPSDFPPAEAAELFALHARLELPSVAERAALEKRYAPLEARMRAWPRTVENDPFRAASHELAAHLARAAGLDVLVGFNEFCAPDLDEALDQAVAAGAQRVVVVTAMMTRGGEHAEVDIPAAIERARARHTGVTFVYAWPFGSEQVAGFLAEQVRRLLD